MKILEQDIKVVLVRLYPPQFLAIMLAITPKGFFFFFFSSFSFWIFCHFFRIFFFLLFLLALTLLLANFTLFSSLCLFPPHRTTSRCTYVLMIFTLGPQNLCHKYNSNDRKKWLRKNKNCILSIFLFM